MRARDPNPDTSHLVRAAKERGCGEFGALYERVAPGVYAWAAVRSQGTTRGQLDADDLVQEVWVRALGAFHTYDPERGPFRCWLFGIANHVLRQTLRRFYRGRGGAPDDSKALGIEAVPAELTTLSRKLAEQETLRSFLAAVAELPDEDRRLLIYRGLEGQPHAEVARRLGLEPAAVRKRWERLQTRLRGHALPPGTLDS